ncbi:MAG: hypothetical protein HY315_04525 [Acidobacteria bacterium]|nr:hypothetical protein [Acidobacteriota bacterium]
MSRRYLLLAAVGGQPRFFSLRTDAAPENLEATGYRLLKSRQRRVQVVMVLEAAACSRPAILQSAGCLKRQAPAGSPP